MTGLALGCQNPAALDRLSRGLEAVGRGEPSGFEPRRTLELGRAAAFSVMAAVAIDNDASESATVIEVSGRDRPGLLAQVARTLADADLSLQSAHIDNYGERAVDAFYVTRPDGTKLLDPKTIASLKAALHAALVEPEPDRPEARLKLQRARASVAR